MKKTFLSLIALSLACSLFAQTWQKSTGYRGFAHVGGVIGLGSGANSEITLSTTHGYQVVPSYLFVGAGAGLYAHTGHLPIYADFRTQLPSGKWSPFFDARIGYAGLIDKGSRFADGGIFANPSVGITWSVGKNIGLEFMAGYSLHRAVESTITDPLSGSVISKVRKNRGGISLSVGLTF